MIVLSDLRSMEDRIDARLDEINLRLDQLERLAHGGRGVYVGNNRILVKTAFGGLNLVFVAEADDRLLVPRFFATGAYEPELTEFFLTNLEETSNCLDVGANFGYYTCIMAGCAPRGKAIGVEPQRHVFDLLRDNIYINGLEGVATPMHAAAGREAGTLTLNRRLTRSGNTSLIKESDEKITRLGETASEAFDVRCVPIDTLLPEFSGRIDFIKVDVEGAEPLVLAGARQTLARNPDISIVMEWAPSQIHGAGFDLSQFTRDLADMGLSAASLGADGPEPISWDALLGTSYLSGVLLTSTV